MPMLRATASARRRSGTGRATAAAGAAAAACPASGAVTARIRNHASTPVNAATTGASRGQEDPLKAVARQRRRRLRHPRPTDDGVTARPRGPGQRPRAAVRARRHASAALAVMRRGERVGGVDDGVDAFVRQPAAQPVDTAEPADAHLADRQRRIGHPAGQRTDHRRRRDAARAASARASAVPPSSSTRISAGSRGAGPTSTGSCR